ERQTGLLVPTIEFAGSGGPALGMNFFWAISRSQDATFSGKYYTKRGLKGLVNYRYVLSETSKGELNFGLIRDNVFGDQNYNGQSFKGHENRHFVNYEHSYDLPDGFNQKMKINYASDLNYVRDFPIELVGRGDPALESRFTLSKNTERTHASLDSSYYINQLQSNPIASNRDSVQRWPELRYSLAERSLADSGTFSRVLFNMNFDYVNFARDGLAWDDVYTTGPADAPIRNSDPSRNNGGPAGGATAGTPGVFDPGLDVIRTGQRLDFQPELSLPFRVAKVLDVLPSIQFRHTQYELNVNPPTDSNYQASPYRQYVRARISTRMRFSQIYGDRTPEAQEQRPSVTNWYDAESRGVEEVPPPKPLAQRPSLFRHEFEPELVISALPGGVNQTKNSAFLGEDVSVPAFLDYQPISNSEFQTGRLQFDYEDR
ncbi:MAG: LPS-assembly protein LptD, partial [Proteobacteria bacterium]